MSRKRKIIFIILSALIVALSIGVLFNRRIYDHKGDSELYGLCYIGTTIERYKEKVGYYPSSDGGKLPKILFRKKNIDGMLSLYIYKTIDITNNHGFDLYWIGLNEIYEMGSGDDKSYWRDCQNIMWRFIY